MRRVGIVTDSTADVPPDLAEELGIAVLPCLIYFGEQVYQDGVDLAPQSFFDKLAHSPELPRTTQPPLGHFVQAYREMLGENGIEKVLSIHIAGSLTGTINGAWAAAQTLPDPSCVEVIDTGQLSMGTGWAAIEAARLARTGVAASEVTRAVKTLLPRLRVAAVLDTLDNLRKGGRINQVSAALGTALQIKPLLSIRNGRVHVVAKVRSRSKALDRLQEMVHNWGPLAEAAVLHTGDEAAARALSDQIRDLVGSGPILLRPAGSALTTHLGLGAVGVCAVTAASA